MAQAPVQAEDLIPSVMEQFPAYVHQIGMITIELANVESSLADLLATILGVDDDLAHSIYFTPKAVIPRVEVLSNVQSVLHPNVDLDAAEMKEIRKRLKNVCERAVAVMGKRNNLLHAMWGKNANDRVHFSSLPLRRHGFAAADLNVLKRIVDDMRRLIGDIKYLQAMIEVYRENGDEEV